MSISWPKVLVSLVIHQTFYLLDLKENEDQGVQNPGLGQLIWL